MARIGGGGGEREAGWEVGHAIWQCADSEWETGHGWAIASGLLASLIVVSVITGASVVPAAIFAVASRLGPVSPAFVGLHPATDRLG